MNKKPILIIGKNGKTGSRVDARQRALGLAAPNAEPTIRIFIRIACELVFPELQRELYVGRHPGR